MKRQLLLSLLFACLFANPLKAQWTSDTMVNLMIADTTGGQELPKISYTSDGGLFIFWFDTRSGSNYRAYLQRLDSLGNKMFAPQGLLISSNAQNTSTNDYSLITDDSDNAIIVFTDLRKGSILASFAYKISSSGTFLWGSNGVDLHMDSTGAAVNPVVTQTGSGDYIFAWPYTVTGGTANIAMQRLNRAGVPQWNNGRPLLFTRPANTTFDNIRLVPSDNNFIAAWYSYNGTFMSMSNFKILAKKFDLNAQPMWSTTLDTMYSGNPVPTAYKHVVITDKSGGALFAWTYGVGASDIYANIQHRDKTGVDHFPKNGMSVGASTGKQLQPYPAIDTVSKNIYAIWRADNGGQSMTGLYLQKFSDNGTQLWTNAGLVLEPLGNSFTNGYVGNNISAHNNYVVGSYTKSLSLTGQNNVIKAFRVDTGGVIAWGGIHTMAALQNNKSNKLVGTLDQLHSQYYMVWTDNRMDNSGIYGQNIYMGTPKLAGGLPLVDAHSADSILCAGASLNLAYNTKWPYFNDNKFKVLLSNGSGSFAAPDTISVINDSESGAAIVILPDTLSGGTGYKIRVIGNSPNSVGGNLSQDIIIYPKPHVTLTLEPDTIYYWSAGVQLRGGSPVGGKYIGAGIDGTGFLNPYTMGGGTHTVQYVYTNEHGCSDTAQQDMYVIVLTDVAQVANNAGVTVYPNPVQNMLSIKTQQAIDGRISIYNVLGQMVHSDVLQLQKGASVQINTQTWAAGMYAVVIESNGDKTIMQVAKQ